MYFKFYRFKCGLTVAVYFQVSLKLNSKWELTFKTAEKMSEGRIYSPERVGVHGVLDRCTRKLPLL